MAGMSKIYSTAPFPYMIFDNYFNEDCIAMACDDWPDNEWSGWFRYEDDNQRGKLVAWSWDEMASSHRELLGMLMTLPVQMMMGISGLVPDGCLYGAGIFSMPSGVYVAKHLDADRHPFMGRRRSLSVMLFCNQRWDDNWGGELVLYGEDGSAQVAIRPKFNRLVLFSAGDECLHSVNEVDCAPGESRKTLNVFYYGEMMSQDKAKRHRAEFVKETV